MFCLFVVHTYSYSIGFRVAIYKNYVRNSSSPQDFRVYAAIDGDAEAIRAALLLPGNMWSPVDARVKLVVLMCRL